jgi:hypothetical protein
VSIPKASLGPRENASSSLVKKRKFAPTIIPSSAEIRFLQRYEKVGPLHINNNVDFSQGTGMAI